MHPPRRHGADAAADGETRHTSAMPPTPAGGMRRQRRHDRDRHAGHAEQVAAAARFRARQSAQRQDEQNPGDQIRGTSQMAFIGRSSLLLFLIHGEHALGDEEAARRC